MVHENFDISILNEKDISIISNLSGYVFWTFYRRFPSTRSNTSSYYQHQCFSFSMIGKPSGDNLPSPEHEHIEILGCKNILSTLMKNPIIHDNKSKIRSKSIDGFIKKDIALNLIQNLLALYIRVRTYSFAKAQIQSHKTKQSRFKSRSLWTSLKNMDFENWRVSLTIEWTIFMVTNN